MFSRRYLRPPLLSCVSRLASRAQCIKDDTVKKSEGQVERFAPEFVFWLDGSSPVDLEAMDANLVGGDIGGE